MERYRKIGDEMWPKSDGSWVKAHEADSEIGRLESEIYGLRAELKVLKDRAARVYDTHVTNKDQP